MSCQFEYTSRAGKIAGYHPPACGPRGLYRGKGWRDMPGNCEDMQRMNFRLFVRGLHTGETSTEKKDRLIRNYLRLKN